MAGGQDRYRRYLPVRATPDGTVHYEEPPVPVRVTLRFTRPDAEYDTAAWVVAWTRNAVLAVWFVDTDAGQRLRSGWLPPGVVTRI